MDEKHHLSAHLPLYRQPNLLDRAKRRRRHLLLLLVSTIWTIIFIWHLNSKGSSSILTPNRSPTMSLVPSATGQHKRVPLEAHIMSKCPDSKDCLHDLVLPAMQRVADKVNFKLSYIGSASDKDDSVECKHGPPECLGNMIELCAADIYPDPKIYLGFTMCLTRDYARIPDRDLVQDCALEHAIDFGKINACVSRDDGYGLSLLRDSVERTQKAGVKYSCTVRLDDRVRCIRDGGQWKDCEGGSSVDDLVRDVENLYSRSS